VLALDDREHGYGGPDARKGIDHVEDGTETDLRVGTRAEDIAGITQQRSQQEHGRDRGEKGHEVEDPGDEGSPPRGIERCVLRVWGLAGIHDRPSPSDFPVAPASAATVWQGVDGDITRMAVVGDEALERGEISG